MQEKVHFSHKKSSFFLIFAIFLDKMNKKSLNLLTYCNEILAFGLFSNSSAKSVTIRRSSRLATVRQT